MNMVEAIFLQLSHLAAQHRPVGVTIVRAARHVGRPIFFSTLIILVAFIPLFTMIGVPGKIFAPMSVTYGFALLGALLIAVTLSPVLCALLLKPPLPEKDTRFVAWLKRLYLVTLRRVLANRGLTVALAAGLLRSEEHTSELQSRLHLVCRLLLEKKKNTTRGESHDTSAKHT